MPNISIILNTVRYGSMDVLFWSLDRQTFPLADIEIILVDGLYDVRFPDITKRDILPHSFLRGRLRHIPQPNKTDLYDVSSGFNAGLREAEGELIIFLADMIWLYPDFLADHWRMYKEFRGYTLSGYVDRYPYPEFGDTSGLWTIFKEEFTPDVAARFLLGSEPVYRERKGGFRGPDVPGTPYYEMPGHLWYAGHNDSIPMAVLKEIGGWDESFNGGYGSNDIDLGMRANFAGHKFLVKPDSVTCKLGTTEMSKQLPALKKKMVKTPSENYQLYLNNMRDIQTGQRGLKPPKGRGAWE